MFDIRRRDFITLLGGAAAACTGRRSDRMSAPGKAGAIQPVEARPKSRSSVRLVASVAWPLATVVAKRTQRLHGVWD